MIRLKGYLKIVVGTPGKEDQKMLLFYSIFSTLCAHTPTNNGNYKFYFILNIWHLLPRQM